MNTASTLSYYSVNAEKRRKSLNSWGLKSRDIEARSEGDSLIRFATRAGANPDALKELSFLADFSSRRNLLKLKGQIVKGEMEALFPTEKMVGKSGESALGISDYLGNRKVDLCVRAALQKENVPGEKRALEYLRWAARNGAVGVRERALAGLAVVIGNRLKHEENIVVRSSMLAADESARVLRAELGRGNADEVLSEQRKGGKVEPWAIFSLSACLGAGAGSAAGFLHELGAAGRPELRFAIVFGLASLIALIAVEISKIRALPFLAERIGGMLGEREGKAGQL